MRSGASVLLAASPNRVCLWIGAVERLEVRLDVEISVAIVVRSGNAERG
jgi:hypothetical protein